MYVGNLSYDVKYRDLIEFMRGGGLGRFSSRFLLTFLGVVVLAERRRQLCVGSSFGNGGGPLELRGPGLELGPE